MNDHLKQAADVISFSTVAATVAGWLPVVYAFVGSVWVCIRVYETRTVQKWIGHKPKTRRED